MSAFHPKRTLAFAIAAPFRPRQFLGSEVAKCPHALRTGTTANNAKTAELIVTIPKAFSRARLHRQDKHRDEAIPKTGLAT